MVAFHKNHVLLAVEWSIVNPISSHTILLTNLTKSTPTSTLQLTFSPITGPNVDSISYSNAILVSNRQAYRDSNFISNDRSPDSITHTKPNVICPIKPYEIPTSSPATISPTAVPTKNPTPSPTVTPTFAPTLSPVKPTRNLTTSP